MSAMTVERVLPLSDLARMVAVQALLGHRECSSKDRRTYLHFLLKSQVYSAVTEDIVKSIVRDTPHLLTNFLLRVMVPPHVTQLNLKGCTGISAVGIERLLSKCQRLEILDLSECSQLTRPSFFQLMGHISPHITSLTMSECSGIDDHAVRMILRSMPKLQHLGLAMCDGITDKVFLVNETVQLSKQAQLKTKLKAVPSSSGKQQPGHQLSSVDVSGCHNITSSCIRHLTTLCGASLRHLNISWTKMDCTVLWYLSGYSLSTAVSLALAVDKMLEGPNKVLGDPSVEGLDPGNDGLDGVFDPDLQEEGAVGHSPQYYQQEFPDDNSDNEAGPSGRYREFDNAVLEPDSDSMYDLAGECQRKPDADSRRSSNLGENISQKLSYVLYKLSSCLRDAGQGVVPLFSKLSTMTRDTPCHGSKPRTLLRSETKEERLSDSSDEDYTNELNVRRSQSSHLQHYGSTDRGASESSLNPGDASRSWSSSSDPTNSQCDPTTSKQSNKCDTGKGSADSDPATKKKESKEKSDYVDFIKGDKNSKITQIFQPNIISLDISNIGFQNTELGKSCLKAFFLANENVHKFTTTWRELSDEMLVFITDHAPSLVSLSLVDCQSLTTLGVSHLCAKATQLRQLNLQGVSFIGDAAVLPLIAKGSIHTLNIAESNITDYSLKKIADNCQEQLTDLDLSWCDEISEEGVEAIAGSCSHLQRLSLRQAPVTECILTQLSNHCNMLTYLSLSSVNCLTDASLTALALRMNHLQIIDIGWNASVSCVGVGALLEYCLSLKEAHLPGIKQLTSDPILPIISDVSKWRKSQALLRLKLHEQRELEEDSHYSSDEEFDALCLPHRSTCYAVSLRFLDLEYCDQINDTHIAEIVAVCRGTLTVMDYYGSKVEPAWISCEKGKVYMASGQKSK